MENNTKKAAIIPALFLSFFIGAQEVPETQPADTQELSQQTTESTTAEAEQAKTEAAAEAEQSTIESVAPYQMYVTEELFIFVHSGSSNQYRITGRIAASDNVEVIARDTATGWLQVNYANNKTGWVDSNNITDSAGTPAELEQANTTISALRKQLAEMENQPDIDVEQLQQQLASLQSENEGLSGLVSVLTEEKAAIESSIAQRDETQVILDKLYDVGVILIGVFVGWLLTRRKRSGISFNHL